eukprot:2287176-Pyramimonas_sp.AAC.1
MSCRHEVKHRQLTVVGRLVATWEASSQGGPLQLCPPLIPKCEGHLVAPAIRRHVSGLSEALNSHADCLRILVLRALLRGPSALGGAS